MQSITTNTTYSQFCFVSYDFCLLREHFTNEKQQICGTCSLALSNILDQQENPHSLEASFCLLCCPNL